MNSYLLLDIGNSVIKIAKSNGDKIFKIKKIKYSDSDFFNIISNLKYDFGDDYSQIGVSLLDKNKKKKISGILKRNFNKPPYFIKLDKNLPIKFNYSNSLGSDRICSTVGAYLKYKNKKNILVIDFGTATTFNLILNGVYAGGMISAGIQTILKSLFQNAGLPLLSLKNIPELINNNTNDNIVAGAYYQNLFTVDNVINGLRKKYKDLFVIATGGMAKPIMKKTKLINILEPNLVLEGINFILKYNKGI